MQARGEDVFRFLIKVDQMQKHVSVWEVHVLENPRSFISNGEQSFIADYQSETDLPLDSLNTHALQTHARWSSCCCSGDCWEEHASEQPMGCQFLRNNFATTRPEFDGMISRS